MSSPAHRQGSEGDRLRSIHNPGYNLLLLVRESVRRQYQTEARYRRQSPKTTQSGFDELAALQLNAASPVVRRARCYDIRGS
jgi:hypothetical protein